MPGISRNDRRVFFVIILIALALRIAYIIDISDSPHFNFPMLDSYWYDDKAKDVLGGDALASSASFRVPLYVYFIAGCYSVFGHSYFATVLMQAVLGALICGLVFLIARRIFGLIAGVVAGLLSVFYRMAIYSDGELLPTTLFILFILASVYFVLNAIEKEKIIDGILTGLFLGLAFWTRPDILPFSCAIGIAVVGLLGARRGIRIGVSFWVVLIGFMLLLGLRNYAAFGEFFVFSPQGAVNLYVGNAAYADGKTPLAPRTRFPYEVMADPAEDSMILAFRQAATESVGRELTDSQLSGYYMRKTLGEIRNDFPRWLGLILKKTYYFLNSYERSGIKLIPRFIAMNSGVLKLPLVTYSVVMSLGVVGLWLSLKRRVRLAWIIAAGFLAYALNTIGFFVIWRYRLPAVPFLTVFAGYTGSRLYLAARSRALRSILLTLGAVAVLAMLSISRFWGITDEQGASTYIMKEGALYMSAGRQKDGIESFKEAIEIAPTNPKPYFLLGRAYAARGLIDESKEVMDQAMRLNQDYRPFAYCVIGVALANKGDSETAASYFEKALDAKPDLGVAVHDLGQCMMELGNYEEAEKAFTRAQYLCRDDKEVLASIAMGFINMGRYEKGIALARTVLEADPDYVQAIYAIGLGLEAQGKTGEALTYFQRALRYMPSSAEIRRKIQELQAGQLER